jgi:superfamily I DNA/RNA helicase
MHVTLSLERGIDQDVRMGDRLALVSIHAAKGHEWLMVFITGCEDRLLLCSLFGDFDEE